MNKIFIFLIRFYQVVLSPFLGMNCRFHPCCSEYARQAYSEFGFLKATRIVMARILKCGPWHSGGVDYI